ncbi:MAG: peptidoglycan DD-metalloendopeptidase family protein [Thermoanaerobaculia bacterium]|nr:peptidoglycan DD-metalloendopeptidase family protein [Thermoanaerobaculia bacterium]
MKRAALLLATVVVVALVQATGGLAQVVDSESKAALENLRQEVKSLRSTLERVRGQAKSAERDLEATRLELEILERELGMAQELQAGLELQSKQAATRIEELNVEITRQKRFLGERLAALYRLGSLSYLRLLLTMEEEQNPLESVTMLSYLISRDGREIDRFRAMQRALTAERAGIEERSKKIADLRVMGDSKRRAIAARKRDQEVLLTTLRRQAGRSEQRLADLEERAQRLERLLGILYGRKGADSTQAASVSEFRGALQWPAKGEVVENFGKVRSQKFATYTVNNGIKIAAKPGSTVSAVFYGTVIYSQWFKGYGNLVVIDHGERVYSLYGNTRGPVVAVGNKVTPGQVITSVADGDDGGGFLYFEVREDNKPTDPRRWLR